MLKKIITSALLFGSLTTSAVAIDSYHIECDSCVTDAQFTQFAKDNAIHRQTVYIHVMNIENYNVKKYSVYKNNKTVCDPNGREPDGEGGFIYDCWLEHTLTANEVSLTNAELNTFNYFADLQNHLSSISLFAIDTPKEVLDSAYELIGASYNETAVSNYFNSLPVKQTIVEKTGLYLESMTTVATNSYIKINARPIVFEFDDGGKAYAVLSFEDMDNVIHLKFVKVFDKNGNVIDLVDENNPFSPKFKTDGLSLLTTFKAYGLAVPGVSTKIVPRGSVIIVDCSTSTETVCKNPL
ncbi:hypothetical protein ACVBIL_20060 [Shewanella sp. 125m-7]